MVIIVIRQKFQPFRVFYFIFIIVPAMIRSLNLNSLWRCQKQTPWLKLHLNYY